MPDRQTAKQASKGADHFKQHFIQVMDTAQEARWCIWLSAGCMHASAAEILGHLSGAAVSRPHRPRLQGAAGGARRGRECVARPRGPPPRTLASRWLSCSLEPLLAQDHLPCLHHVKPHMCHWENQPCHVRCESDHAQGMMSLQLTMCHQPNLQTQCHASTNVTATYAWEVAEGLEEIA